MKRSSGRADYLILAGAVVAFGAGIFVWLTGEMAGLLGNGRWPAVPPTAMGSVLVRLPSTMGHPARAWPNAVRSQLPGAPGWYVLSAAVTVTVLFAVGGAAVVATGLARAKGRGTLVAGHRSRADRVHAGRRRAGGRSSRANRVSGRSAGANVGGRFASANTARGRSARANRIGGRGWRPPVSGGRGAPAALGGWLGGAGAGWNPGGVPGHRPVGGAHWAARGDLGSLRVRRSGGGRLVLGRVGRAVVATEARHSVLVLGPTQSGKTTALAIPALLEWDGPAVATSVKDDLVVQTRAYRGALGRVWVFDPTGATRAGGRSRWSPVTEASTWSGAQRVAQALVGAAPSHGGLSDGAFWFSAAAKLLAPLLLAAERGGRPIGEVVRWTNLQETEEVRLLLELAGETEAVHALVAGLSRDERIRSSIYTTLETVLAPYEDPVVAESAERADIDPVALIQGRNTLYLCGPAHEQARVQGVFTALVGAIVHAAVSRYEDHGPLDPPLLVVLDEAANIAPLPDLDQLASTGAGMGIQLVTVCQDLAQLNARYGPDRARSIANNHRAKVALSGIADIGTLDTISGLAGEQAVREQTFTTDRREGRHSTSSSISYRRLAAADELRRIPPGRGVLIYGHLPPARLVLRPWYTDPELRRRVNLPNQVDLDVNLKVCHGPSGESDGDR